MPGVIHHYDNATLEVETERGKSPKYLMSLARHSVLWVSLHNDLETLFNRNQSEDINTTDTRRIETILKFAQIAFAHGQDVQDLAMSANIHTQIIKYIPHNPKLCYNALANLITRNPQARVVMAPVLDSEAINPYDLWTDLPTSALLFLRNSLAGCPSTGEHDTRCALIIGSDLLRLIIARPYAIEHGFIPRQDKEDESWRFGLSAAIFDNLFSSLAGENCVMIPDFMPPGDLRLSCRNEIFRFMEFFCSRDKAYRGFEFSSHIVTQLEFAVEDVTTAYAEKSEKTILDLEWIGASLLLSALVAVSSQEEIPAAVHSNSIAGREEALRVVIDCLGLAHKHFPRSKSGRAQSPIDLDEESPDLASLPSKNGLRNFKRNCITIILFLIRGDQALQDVVRERGGIPLILAQCQIDDMNPFLREHALLCLRLVLENNDENQAMLAGLTPLGITQDPILEDMGVSAEVRDGKVVLTSIDSSEVGSDRDGAV